MASVSFPVRLAPDYLNQSILPGWQVSLFSVNLGESSNADMERTIVENVGSYGKQLGHIAEALELVIDKLGLLQKDLTPEEKDTLLVFLGDAAQIRQLKHPKTSPKPAAPAKG